MLHLLPVKLEQHRCSHWSSQPFVVAPRMSVTVFNCIALAQQLPKRQVPRNLLTLCRARTPSKRGFRTNLHATKANV
eukprot:5205-Amphidinium_carterae.1